MLNSLSGSRTYIGLLIALIPTVANLVGYEVSATFSEDFTALAEDLIALVGIAIAFYGRAVATTQGLLVKKD